MLRCVVCEGPIPCHTDETVWPWWGFVHEEKDGYPPCFRKWLGDRPSTGKRDSLNRQKLADTVNGRKHWILPSKESLDWVKKGPR